MKPLAAKSYPYTANYFGYTTFTNSEGIVVKQYNSTPTSVKLALSINLLGELVMDSETKMQFEGRLVDVVDKNGDEIYEDGEWEIRRSAPNLSPLGIKEDYRYYAKIIAGNI